MLYIGPSVRGFKAGLERWILRVGLIVIRSTTSLGRLVKPLASCRKILRHVKDPLRCDRY
jgi:hypothetical protein